MITQQLQADQFAVTMASQLLSIAPDPEAKLYYTTMVQDEARHTEAWLRLANEAGGTAEHDPHLDRLAHMFLDLDTLEEKVFLMQVFFERLIIPRFRQIARASPGTVLENLCNRLTIDDGIHHGPVSPTRRCCSRRPTRRRRAADRGREPDDADLRRARPLAAERAGLHRRHDARRATSRTCART